MSQYKQSCPMPRSKVIDTYFMEHRAKLIDLAAFLDRVERAEDDGVGDNEFRVAALKKAAAMLTDGQPQRAQRILEFFSDHSDAPLDKAGMKGAYGVTHSPEGSRR